MEKILSDASPNVTPPPKNGKNTKRDPYWANGGDPAKVGRLGELLMEVRNGLK